MLKPENRTAYRFPKKIENKLDDQMVKQVSSAVIAKYRDLSVTSHNILLNLLQ